MHEVDGFHDFGHLRIGFSVENAWARVRNDSSDENWLLAGYRAPTAVEEGGVREHRRIDEIVIVGEGSGGRTECLQRVDDLMAKAAAAAAEGETIPSSLVVYGGVRVIGMDDNSGSGIVSRRNKFAFFSLLPDGTPPKWRAKAGMNEGHVREVSLGLV